MTRLLVCPFGGLDLIVSLVESLRSRYPDRYEVTYLSFTEYGRLVYDQLPGDHIHIPPGEEVGYLPPEVLKELLVFSNALLRSQGLEDRGGILERHAHWYAHRLEETFDQGRFDYVVLFNGRFNLFVHLLDQIADSHGCDKLVFEQGLFRPGYITVDGRGVNYLNSVESVESLLSPDPYRFQRSRLYQDLRSLLPVGRSWVRNYKRSVPALDLLKAHIVARRRPRECVFLRTPEGRDFLEAAFLKKLPRLPTRDPVGTAAPWKAYQRIVLCPLQVESDTQIVLYSPYVRDMQALVDLVSAAVARVNTEAQPKRTCVVFKSHPMEPAKVSVGQPDTFHVSATPIPALLDICDAVVTINSTVGIEAIEQGLPVITLGQAFYSWPGVVASHCEEPDQLADALYAALTSPRIDRPLQQRVIAGLRAKYQVKLFEDY